MVSAVLAQINHPIIIQDVTKVIKGLPLNKSLGIDGLSSEYYKAFSSILSPHLVNVFNAAATVEKIPKEMLKAVIVALPKPGNQPNQSQNFRPISLSNSDLKVFLKILTNRILDITPLLIGPEQVGFVKGRQAPDGTRRIHLIHYVESGRVPSLLLALDAEKAFDRVPWEYLSNVLVKLLLSIPQLCPCAKTLLQGYLYQVRCPSNNGRVIISYQQAGIY